MRVVATGVAYMEFAYMTYWLAVVVEGHVLALPVSVSAVGKTGGAKS